MSRLAAAGVAALLVGCVARDATVPPLADGVLSVTWTDSNRTARFRAPALGSWCADRQELLITAQRGDTGIAVLVAFGGPRKAGAYPVRSDGQTPRGSVALRQADRLVLRAWRADSGAITLSAVDANADGTFAVRAVTVQEDRLVPTRLIGRFSGTPIVADTACTPP